MSNLVMTQAEEKSIDAQIEQMMDWAKTRSAEAEQLALDSARLMACTTDRVDRLKNQGFFKRCWNRFSGKAGEMERANTNDIIQMQKTAFRYVNMLQEQQLLMAHSLLSLKNNLISLAVKEEETRNLIGMLAQRTLERFENLENRVDQLEISTNLQGWLLGLEEREYDEKIPTEYMRLFRVINDFYNIKKDNWNYNDLMFMRKAIRTVGLNPKQKISLNSFIDKLTDEIQSEGVGFEAYGQAITMFKPEGIENYSKYVIENISSPVFVSMHGLKTQYMDRLDIVEELQDEMNISAGEALKRLLRRSINNMNVNLDYEFPLAETAIEILGCLRLSELLNNRIYINENSEVPQNKIESIDNKLAKPEEGKKESTPENSKIEVNKTQHPDKPKVINIKKLKISGWEEYEGTSDTVWTSFFIDKLKSIIEVDHAIYLFYNCRFCKINENNKVIEICDLGKASTASSLLYFDNRFLAMTYSGVYSSDGKSDFKLIDISSEYEDRDVTYKEMYTNGKMLFIYGTIDEEYSYTKKGFFTDSTATASYETPIIFYGTSLTDMECKIMSQKFPKYDSFGSAYIDDTLVVVMRHIDDDDYIYISSKDGKKFEKKSLDYDDYISNIITIGDICFIDGHKFNIKSGIIDKSKNELYLPKDKLINFPKYGVAFYHIEMHSSLDKERAIYIIDSNYNHRKIGDIDANATSIGFNGKEVIAILNNGKIIHCEIL